MRQEAHVPWQLTAGEACADVLKVYFDGGSDLRAGRVAGAMWTSSCRSAFYLGLATNNEAEYVGALLGLLFVACQVLQIPVPAGLFL